MTIYWSLWSRKKTGTHSSVRADTHVWVSWVDPQANPLPTQIVDCIETADRLAVSAITCWEVAWLVRRNRLQLKLHLSDWLDLRSGGAPDMDIELIKAQIINGL